MSRLRFVTAALLLSIASTTSCRHTPAPPVERPIGPSPTVVTTVERPPCHLPPEPTPTRLDGEADPRDPEHRASVTVDSLAQLAAYLVALRGREQAAIDCLGLEAQ